MGVTVHFEGKLRGEKAFADLLRRVEATAKTKTWLTEKFEISEVTLLRVRGDEEWDYKGPTKGIILYVHEDCDPVRLETQFAGVPAHLELIALLKDLQKFFEGLTVEDEGEYWETGNEGVLAEHIRCCDEMIAEEAAKKPSAQVQVRTPDGRWMDILE